MVCVGRWEVWCAVRWIELKTPFPPCTHPIGSVRILREPGRPLPRGYFGYFGHK
jgi:hypothetical protein